MAERAVFDLAGLCGPDRTVMVMRFVPPEVADHAGPTSPARPRSAVTGLGDPQVEPGGPRHLWQSLWLGPLRVMAE